MDTNQRITDLEVRIAFQDHTISILDEVVREFSGRVEALERKLTELRESVADQNPIGPAGEPPPHY